MTPAIASTEQKPRPGVAFASGSRHLIAILMGVWVYACVYRSLSVWRGGLYQIAEVVEGGMIKMVAFSIMIEVKAKMGLNHGIIRR